MHTGKPGKAKLQNEIDDTESRVNQLVLHVLLCLLDKHLI